jgi:hypothetical protein
VCVEESRQVYVGERIAIEDEERFLKERFGVLDGAGRAQWAWFNGVMDRQPEGSAIAYRGHHVVAPVSKEEDYVCDRPAAQPFEHIRQERLAAHLDEALGPLVRNAPQPGGQPSRQNRRRPRHHVVSRITSSVFMVNGVNSTYPGRHAVARLRTRW